MDVTLTHESNGVSIITLNRPEVRNAFNGEMIHVITEHLETLSTRLETRIILLKGEGKHFSAGADLNHMKSMADFSFKDNVEDALALSKMFQTLYFCRKPTVVRVQGAAFGGAAGLLACADVVIASEDAKVCFSEVKLGLVPSVISPFVVRAIGERQAIRYFQTAEVISAERAQMIGLVHEVVPEDELDGAVNNIVDKILKNGPSAMSTSKQLARDASNRDLDEKTYQHTAAIIAKARTSEEGQEGIQAFLEKRDAKF